MSCAPRRGIVTAQSDSTDSSLYRQKLSADDGGLLAQPPIIEDARAETVLLAQRRSFTVASLSCASAAENVPGLVHDQWKQCESLFPFFGEHFLYDH